MPKIQEDPHWGSAPGPAACVGPPWRVFPARKCPGSGPSASGQAVCQYKIGLTVSFQTLEHVC